MAPSTKNENVVQNAAANNFNFENLWVEYQNNKDTMNATQLAEHFVALMLQTNEPNETND
jgi:hypothetical protein